MWPKALFFLILTVAVSSSAQEVPSLKAASSSPSSVNIKKTQGHIRTGIIEGKYNGTFRGDFQVTMAFDLEYEIFKSNSDSFLFRFIQGLDSESVPFYTYAGLGNRFYINSKGPASDQREKGFFISTKPKIRTYVGVDYGISQVIVKSFGPNVQSVANMLDIGGNLGALYQLSDAFAVELQIGGSLGYGISSTPQNGHTMRSFIGGAYFF